MTVSVRILPNTGDENFLRTRVVARYAILGSLSIAGLGMSPNATAQPPRGFSSQNELSQIDVDWSVHISEDATDLTHVEPWLAASPTDSNHLVVSAIVTGSASDSDGCSVYASSDGGRTWVRGRDLSRPGRFFRGGDPMVAFSPSGVPYFTSLADGFSVWRRSEGTNWSRLPNVPAGVYDRQWITFDASGGQHHGRLYTAGKVNVDIWGSIVSSVAALSYSDDGGLTYAAPRLILPHPGREALHVVSDTTVLTDGQVLAAMQTFFLPPDLDPNREPIVAELRGELKVVVSGDGRRWSDPHVVGPIHTWGHADEERMYKGMGGGRLAVDRSEGPYRGMVFAVWPSEMAGKLQILLAASADQGRTWREPLRVNDGGHESNHSNPAIAVDDHGHVAVLWNDRRNDATDRCFRPYIAVSSDGGKTFSRSVMVNVHDVCPGGSRWINGGETQGLVAVPGGFQAAWIGSSDAVMQLWTSRITVR